MKKNPIVLSIGMMAWNEEESIGTTLESLFRQSAFEKLCARHEQCEILVLANGCTDRTVAVARELFDRMEREHPWAEGFTARVIDIPEPGRNNAWNRFVHEFSAVEARFIALMDADIVFHHRDTIYSLIATLERRPHVCATSGRQCKDLMFKERKTFWERMSLATSEMTGTIQGQISGQLYCMRAKVARNLLLPRDLGANDDGFFKAAICTDFFSRPLDPSRIIMAPDAAHIYEAYISPRDILNNQKRQMIGQTSVHVLLQYLKTLSFDDRANLAETLRRHESQDPDWLKRMISDHVRARPFFWQLFPGILTFRFKRLLRMSGFRKVTHAPAAMAGFIVTMVACARAHRALRAGTTQFWPKPTRQTILSVPQSAK
ncbi:MAG: glycosyltransferase [Opitutaceae bacterium]|nr:glycosyltransferase [Opitutaceae bacterium]